MFTYISMLKGINVGGQKQVRMETLRDIYEELGFTSVRTYIQSGNVIFKTTVAERYVLAQQLETHIKGRFGFSVPVFLRQADELAGILAGNPFINDRHADPSKLYVTFLYQPPTEAALAKLISPGDDADEFTLGSSAIYLYCPNGYGKTRLSNSLFERKLGTPVTTRNWNSVNTLYKMALE